MGSSLKDTRTRERQLVKRWAGLTSSLPGWCPCNRGSERRNHPTWVLPKNYSKLGTALSSEGPTRSCKSIRHCIKCRVKSISLYVTVCVGWGSKDDTCFLSRHCFSFPAKMFNWKCTGSARWGGGERMGCPDEQWSRHSTPIRSPSSLHDPCNWKISASQSHTHYIYHVFTHSGWMRDSAKQLYGRTD